MPCIEAAAALAPGFIKRHEAGHIIGSDRPAERASRQVFGNLLRAGGLADWLLFLSWGSQTKIRARLAVLDTPVELNGPTISMPLAKARHAVIAIAEAEDADAVEAGGNIVVRFHVGTVDECHDDIVHAGLSFAPESSRSDP